MYSLLRVSLYVNRVSQIFFLTIVHFKKSQFFPGQNVIFDTPKTFPVTTVIL